MLFLGSDHRGYRVKEEIKTFLDNSKIKYIDCGTDSEESVNYPDFAKKVSENVQKDEKNAGILICGTGIGMSIVANKFKGIRCALCYDINSAKYSKMHNNSNVLALSENTELEKNIEIVKVWYETNFEGNRHKIRLDIIKNIEDENFK